MGEGTASPQCHLLSPGPQPQTGSSVTGRLLAPMGASLVSQGSGGRLLLREGMGGTRGDTAGGISGTGGGNSGTGDTTGGTYGGISGTGDGIPPAVVVAPAVTQPVALMVASVVAPNWYQWWHQRHW